MVDPTCLLVDLFQAYLDARKHKRNTHNQLEFEANIEENIVQLHRDLLSGTYQIGRSVYFIQQYPIKREIFAGNFRDRVVHHLIYNYISPILERQFIYDSYSCRKGKGTSLWVKRVNKFIRSCSNNYTQDCYVLKLDIQGYFMAINKDLLYRDVVIALEYHQTDIEQQGIDLQFILFLIHKVIYNDCIHNSVFKGRKKDYVWLPQTKSLFFAQPRCWLPIWNLTSQLFSNIYLNGFDHYIKNGLGIKYYGRYVDDFVLIHHDREYLKSLIPSISTYLKEECHLLLHPSKIYLQHYSKGVLFLGTMIKPYRNYLRKRTFGYFYQKMQTLNKTLREAGDNEILFQEVLASFPQVINSYLWFLQHYQSYKKRKYFLSEIVDVMFWQYFTWNEEYTKVTKAKNST